MRFINKAFQAFSLAELMIVLSIMSIVLATTMPLLSKRAKMKAANAIQVLPVVTEGNTCTATNTKNTGISSDYTTLLTCQSGIWKKVFPSAAGIGQTLYTYGYSYNSSTYPAACPAGWTDLGYGVSGSVVAPCGSNYYTYTRACYNPNQTCAAMYLYGYDSSSGTYPVACPAGWTDKGYGVSGNASSSSRTYYTYIRSCYRCG